MKNFITYGFALFVLFLTVQCQRAETAQPKKNVFKRTSLADVTCNNDPQTFDGELGYNVWANAFLSQSIRCGDIALDYPMVWSHIDGEFKALPLPLRQNFSATGPVQYNNTTGVISFDTTGYSKFTINTTTVGLSKAQLNTAYPSVEVGHRVICGSITLGGAIYTKYTENGTNDVWLISNAVPVL